MLASLAVLVAGYFGINVLLPAPDAVQAADGEIVRDFEMCGRERHTCVVDGDTLWLGRCHGNSNKTNEIEIAPIRVMQPQ